MRTRAPVKHDVLRMLWAAGREFHWVVMETASPWDSAPPSTVDKIPVWETIHGHNGDNAPTDLHDKAFDIYSINASAKIFLGRLLHYGANMSRFTGHVAFIRLVGATRTEFGHHTTGGDGFGIDSILIAPVPRPATRPIWHPNVGKLSALSCSEAENRCKFNTQEQKGRFSAFCSDYTAQYAHCAKKPHE